jgi:hypothetical protein
VTWRITGAVCCLAAYGVGWLAEVAGAHALLAPLVVVPALIVLIAGGNWLQQWLGIERPSPSFTQPERADEAPSPDAERP